MKSRLLSWLLFLFLLARCETEAVAQWYAIPQLKYTSIYCFLTTNDSTAFVGGDNALLRRSTNNGSTWTSVIGNGISVDTVLSLGEGCGYIFAGANGVECVYRSSDNGNSWSAANMGLPSSARMNAFTFVGDTLYAATDGGVYSSVDSGGSWKADTTGLALGQLYPGQGGGTVGITSVGSRLYTIKSDWGSVYTSPADSISWTQIAADTLNAGYAIAAIDTNVFIATQRGVYLYSGSGTSWLSRSNGLPVNDTTWLTSCILTGVDSLLFAYISASTSDFYARGIYVTSDLGQTWTLVKDTVFAGASVNAMAANKTYLFAGTQSGAWRIPIADVITSVNDDHPQLPGRYALQQNYPNPFNPTTVIGYQLPANSFVSLEVYDVLGRKIKTLVSEHQSAGAHSVTFDAGSLPSGVYFYRLVVSPVELITTGSFVATKKLMLVK